MTSEQCPDCGCGNEFLDVYQKLLAHQREHDGLLIPPLFGQPEQPYWSCMGCLREKNYSVRTGDDFTGRDVRRRYSFAIPNDQALDGIARHSPGGVVEIGAGGGYWAMLLQQRGLDVIAYDPDPPKITNAAYRSSTNVNDGSTWHSGRAWTEVHWGDHRKAEQHSTRTLMLCWPSYDESWATQALMCYRGDTVIYVGEGSGGCTADNRFHALIGENPYCGHYDDDYNDLPCPPDCPSATAPLFEQIDSVEIPQWAGLHDRLGVYRRIAS